jgi:hypothetical protein
MGQVMACVPFALSRRRHTTLFLVFTYPAAHFLWSLVFEALGPEWQALDLDEFLEEHTNRTGRRMRLSG